MQWVSPEEVREAYGDATNPRRETSRGFTVNEFVELADEHGGELKVGWFPGKMQMLSEGADEVPKEKAVNMRLNAIRVDVADLGEVHDFLDEIPPGVVTEPTGEGLRLLYRID